MAGYMARLPTIPLDQNGRVANDPLSHFKISDSDDANDPQYHGYLTADGAWYIMKISLADKTYRYSTGNSGYAAAWTARASLAYDYFHIIF